MNNNQKIYTLEAFAQMRAEKTAELEKSKDRMTDLVHEMMTPPPSKNNVELWMHYASYGVSAYKGLLTCVKFIRRMKGTFSKKKKSKSIFS